ncbi:hypothetical protein FOZ60_011601 [Perkinsus olseni]|uniref:Uncharacterized protein n=1 Tax=Perkinsus olseni TaxID=32597 RepID=A0A7J6NDA4_PEROL|nr:hypothetical protein FOZ60_011601 [Perkinsus olseni]
MMGQSFTVDFASNGRATINVMGMSAGADYTVDGDDIEFSNYDPMLAKLMHQFHINKIEADYWTTATATQIGPSRLKQTKPMTFSILETNSGIVTQYNTDPLHRQREYNVDGVDTNEKHSEG